MGAAAATILLLLGPVMGVMYGTPVLKGTPVLACHDGRREKPMIQRRALGQLQMKSTRVRQGRQLTCNWQGLLR